MTDATRRLIQNLRPALEGFNVEQLYQLAVGLRHELARRGLDCAPEADALSAALLVAARVEHATIFGADSASELDPETVRTMAMHGYPPGRPRPAEES